VKHCRRGPALSLRRLLGALLAILGLLVGALIVVTTLQVRGLQSQADVENNRILSFQLADSMRQSSNHLTNMVRLYVATGDQRYHDYYDEILAIRSGRAPRPRDYDSSFWDRVLAEGNGFVAYGPPESLVDQMRRADFTAAEFDALNASLEASDQLAQLERGVMDRVEPRARRGVDTAYLGDVRADYDRLVDSGYLAEKGRIMEALVRFTNLVDTRTQSEVDAVRTSNQRLFAIQIAILALIVLVGLGAMAVVSRVAVRPFGRLAEATRRIASGDYGERVDVHGVAELEQVADAFNEMADAIQSDIGARERESRLQLLASRARIVTAADEARRRIQRDLHDGAQQRVVTAALKLKMLAASDAAQASGVAPDVEEVLTDVDDALKDLREIAHGLHPEVLSQGGLQPALKALGRRSAIPVTLHLQVPERLAESVEITAYYLVAEMLTNAAKHANPSHVQVTVETVDDALRLCVRDDGVGGADPARGSGLVSLMDRVHTLGGTMTIDSPPGGGTTLVARLPLGTTAAAPPEAAPV
jgi:signal transduction histidine kinase